MPQVPAVWTWTCYHVLLLVGGEPAGQSDACRHTSCRLTHHSVCHCVSADVLTPHYPWQSSDVSVGMLPPHHGNDFGLEPPGHNKENEDDVEAMSTDSSSSSSDSD